MLNKFTGQKYRKTIVPVESQQLNSTTVAYTFWKLVTTCILALSSWRSYFCHGKLVYRVHSEAIGCYLNRGCSTGIAAAMSAFFSQLFLMLLNIWWLSSLVRFFCFFKSIISETPPIKLWGTKLRNYLTRQNSSTGKQADIKSPENVYKILYRIV